MTFQSRIKNLYILKIPIQETDDTIKVRMKVGHLSRLTSKLYNKYDNKKCIELFAINIDCF